MTLPMRSKTSQRWEMKITYLCNYDSPNQMEVRVNNGETIYRRSLFIIYCNALRLQQSRTHCLKQLFLVIAEHWATFIEWTSLSCFSFYICSFRSLLLVGFKLKGVLLFSSAFPCALPACFCWCTSLYLKDGQLAKLGFYLPFLYLLPSTALSLNGSPLTDPPLTFWRQNLNLRRI